MSFVLNRDDPALLLILVLAAHGVELDVDRMAELSRTLPDPHQRSTAPQIVASLLPFIDLVEVVQYFATANEQRAQHSSRAPLTANHATAHQVAHNTNVSEPAHRGYGYGRPRSRGGRSRGHNRGGRVQGHSNNTQRSGSNQDRGNYQRGRGGGRGRDRGNRSRRGQAIGISSNTNATTTGPADANTNVNTNVTPRYVSHAPTGRQENARHRSDSHTSNFDWYHDSDVESDDDTFSIGGGVWMEPPHTWEPPTPSSRLTDFEDYY